MDGPTMGTTLKTHLAYHLVNPNEGDTMVALYQL